MKDLPAGKLRSLLGLANVSYVQGDKPLAVIDSTLADASATSDTVKIDNFSFTPQTLTVHAGTKVTWINKDDVPHTVTSTDKQFKSRALDTDERFSYTFSAPGTYSYFCSVHPHMAGKIIVR
jgi:plastocyanin